MNKVKEICNRDNELQRKVNHREISEKELNLDFSIKDFDATRAKHDSRIRTLKTKHILYSDIIDNYFEDNLLSNIVSDTQFYFYYRDLFKDGVKKSNVRQLKTFVNYKAREAIQRSLEYNDVSKGYDTAFYVMFYSSINKLLTRITKELLKNYIAESA